MSRIKTFDSTGVAPGGVLYSGDLNAIQDQYADQVNYAQNIGASTYAVGDSTIQLMKYGAAEARLTAALRIDGIFRAFGGFQHGQYTTAQRDAIPAGKRPFGLVIFNLTDNILEMNMGTDASPEWMPLHPDPFPVGWCVPYLGVAPAGSINGTFQPGSATIGISEPMPNWYLANGAELLDGQFTTLRAFLTGAYGIPAAGAFKLPALGGRVIVPQGAGTKFDTIGEFGGADEIALNTGQMPTHNHGGGNHNHGGGWHDHGGGYHDHGGGYHDHYGWTLLPNVGHIHQYNVSSSGVASGSAFNAVRESYAGGSPFVRNTLSAGDHQHPIQAQAVINNQSNITPQSVIPPEANVANEGGGQAHENMPPYQVIGGYVIKVRA